MQKLIYIFIFLSLMYCKKLSAQTNSDRIEIIQGSGVRFKMNGKNLTPNKIMDIVKNNPKSYKEMQKARDNRTSSSILGFIGGFLIGCTLGIRASGVDPKWGFAIAGGGFLLIGLPCSIAYKRHSINAVNIYNNGLKDIPKANIDLKLGLTGHGIGLILNF